MSIAASNSINDSTASTSPLGDTSQTVLARVLLLEEQAHVARVIRHNLECRHYLIELASGIDEAMQWLASERFDALIVSSEHDSGELDVLCRQAARQLDKGDLTQGAARALMLVNCDAQCGLQDTHAGLVLLSRPVSLKSMLQRLDGVFLDAREPQAA